MQIGSLSASALSQMHAKMFSKIDANSDGGVTLEELTASAPTGKTGQTESADSIKSRFTSMDTNSDGSVSEEEGLSYFQSQMSSETMSGMLQAQESASGQAPMGPPPSGGGGQEETTFDDLDTNQDGTVSLAEMQAGLSTSETEDTEESSRIAELFSAMDADGDGSVTETEKSTFDEARRAEGPPSGMGGMGGMAGMGGAGGGQEPASFDDLDTNQDGTVSLAEMQASLSTGDTEDTNESSRISELFSAMDADGDGSVTETEKSAFDEARRAEGPPPPPGAGASTSTAESSDTSTESSSTDSQTAARFAALSKQWLQSMASVMSDRAVSSTTTSIAA